MNKREKFLKEIAEERINATGKEGAIYETR